MIAHIFYPDYHFKRSELSLYVYSLVACEGTVLAFKELKPSELTFAADTRRQ